MTKQKKQMEEIKETVEEPVPESVPPAEEQIVVPEKFKDANGNVNLSALIKSYLELEKKMSTRVESVPKENRPESPDSYRIEIKSNLMMNDPAINQRLFDLGLNNEQVQGVYDLAAEKIVPVIEELAETFQTRQDLSELERIFGGTEQFNTIARQISGWGEKNLDSGVFNALVGTKDGILTLYKMMCNAQETPVLPRTGSVGSDLSESDLKRMMQDPKYWKQQDPELMKRVEAGFKRLYG